MHDFLERLAKVIVREQLFDGSRRVLVAVSGGADSMCLLSSLHRLGYDLLAVHCNFHLRGEESYRDMRFVEEQCRAMNVESVTVHFDVQAYCRKHGVSLEMACRDLRYDEFLRIARERGCGCVAVAHHADDNVETLMLNLLRGTGITGLAAMPYRNSRGVVRPLLDFTRKEILGYLADCGIDYVTDSTNIETDFKRNRLRNVVLPLIEENFPGSSDAIIRTIANLRGNLALYRTAVSERSSAYMERDGSVNLAALVEKESSPATLLFEMLHPLGFNASQCADMVYSVSESGPVFTAPGTGISLNLSHGKLVRLSEELGGDGMEVDISASFDFGDVHFEVSTISREEFKPRRNPMVIYLGAGALSPDNRWEIRPWRRGDRIEPFGLGGQSTLVSDIMRDAHFDESRKRRTLVLACYGRVVWVPGLKTSRHFPVTDADESVLVISVEKSN